MCDLLHLRIFVQEVETQSNNEFLSPDIMYSTVSEDKNGALGLAISPRTTLRTRHIAMKYQFLREHIGEVKGIMI